MSPAPRRGDQKRASTGAWASQQCRLLALGRPHQDRHVGGAAPAQAQEGADRDRRSVAPGEHGVELAPALPHLDHLRRHQRQTAQNAPAAARQRGEMAVVDDDGADRVLGRDDIGHQAGRDTGAELGLRWLAGTGDDERAARRGRAGDRPGGGGTFQLGREAHDHETAPGGPIFRPARSRVSSASPPPLIERCPSRSGTAT
jgi:hypothetical protein